MKIKSEYVNKIENRCYELLLRLRYQLELSNINLPCLNLDFAIRTFDKGYEVDLLKEKDIENIFLSLIKNLINLVCLEEGDSSLVLLEVYNAYIEYVNKSDAVY